MISVATGANMNSCFTLALSGEGKSLNRSEYIEPREKQNYVSNVHTL
jgi:hypothetical protein